MRLSPVLASGLVVLASCGGDRITVEGARSALDFSGVTLTTSRSTYTPANGRVMVDASVFNGSAVPVYVPYCGTALERRTASDWTTADGMFCPDIYGTPSPIGPGQSASVSYSWPDTLPGQYRLTTGVVRPGGRAATLHSPAFTIQ